MAPLFFLLSDETKERSKEKFMGYEKISENFSSLAAIS
jgi:hypothetical protein